MTDFALSRSTRIAAPPARVLRHLDDFRSWAAWSPWADLDANMEHTYSGPERGVGASHAWKGNSKAGEGRMTMTECSESVVECDLEFIKPFKARNVSRFDLAPDREGTSLTWTMTGSQNPLMRLLGKLWFDRSIAKDFDKGLAGIKREAEAG